MVVTIAPQTDRVSTRGTDLPGKLRSLSLLSNVSLSFIVIDLLATILFTVSG